MWWWDVDPWLGLMCCTLDAKGEILVDMDVVRGSYETFFCKGWDMSCDTIIISEMLKQ